MFIGHFGLALAAKRVAPRTSLGTLVAASAWVDAVWPALLLTGAERVHVVAEAPTPFLRLDFEHYPWTHSLAAAVVWAVAFGAAYLWRKGYRTGAWTAGALVASHWVLDLVVHRPDLALWPGGPKVGLGLWWSVPGTLAVELAVFLAGLWVYVASTRPRDRTGRWALASFVVVVLLAYASSLLGPPPPSTTALGISALAGAAALVAWATWADRHREIRPEMGAGLAPVP
ncbi:MAG TPA: hypothetical protein VLU43_12060 [Anaeromyxobacteraceae bacterium]|nr:hypothetical protein [Anaeromyxobacteraceae bacterium]